MEGADGGKLDDLKAPPGELKFARSIPLQKARGDVLLAYKMNDVDLPAQHGFPVRAIVPGWYAMASIKWLQRIIVTDRPFNGYYQTLDYAFWKRRGDFAELTPLSGCKSKTEIARPAPNRSGQIQMSVCMALLGRATGKSRRSSSAPMEDRHGAGRVYSAIRNRMPGGFGNLNGKRRPNPGKQTLMARATDSHGRTQSAERDPDRGTYMINHLLPIEVEVR